MIIKITDGESTHFIECSGDVRVSLVENVFGDRTIRVRGLAEPTAECLEFIMGEVVGGPFRERGVMIRPEGLPLRTYVTNWDAYLMSDKGRTVEVLHRMS